MGQVQNKNTRKQIFVNNSNFSIVNDQNSIDNDYETYLISLYKSILEKRYPNLLVNSNLVQIKTINEWNIEMCKVFSFNLERQLLSLYPRNHGLNLKQIDIMIKKNHQKYVYLILKPWFDKVGTNVITIMWSFVFPLK
jgi:hypothetical protein